MERNHAEGGPMDVECIYCYNIVSEDGEVPAVDDDEMWDAIAPEHDPECEWVVTRAHRILGNLAEEA